MYGKLSIEACVLFMKIPSKLRLSLMLTYMCSLCVVSSFFFNKENLLETNQIYYIYGGNYIHYNDMM